MYKKIRQINEIVYAYMRRYTYEYAYMQFPKNVWVTSLKLTHAPFLTDFIFFSNFSSFINRFISELIKWWNMEKLHLDIENNPLFYLRPYLIFWSFFELIEFCWITFFNPIFKFFTSHSFQCWCLARLRNRVFWLSCLPDLITLITF